MNFTIVNIRVDQPPIFTPSTQAFNVSENLSGVQVGMVSVFVSYAQLKQALLSVRCDVGCLA